MAAPRWTMSSCRRDQELRLDDVEPRHLFRDGMLHLEPRIHLEEVELLALHDELHGSRVDVLDGARPRHRGRGEPLLQARRQVWSWALLDDLLVAALDGAIALVQMHDLAMAIAEDLHLDVPRLGEVALDEERARTEGSARPSLRGGVGLGEGRSVGDLDHADAASARRRLEHERIADAGGDAARLLEGVDRPVAAGDHGYACLLHVGARADLVAHLLDHLPRGAHEDAAGLLARLGEAPVLGEKAVPGMDSLGARLLGGVEDAVDAEIALAGGSGADRHGKVGVLHVRPARVRLGVDGDGADSHGPRSAENAPRDLSAIGDEDALD